MTRGAPRGCRPSGRGGSRSARRPAWWGSAALAWATDLGAAIVVAGAAMAALGALVALRFGEHGFEPTREHRWWESVAIFRRGLALARRDHEILMVFAAIVAISAGAEAFDRLHPRRLVDLGLPDDPDPIVWFTLLGIAGLALDALALRAVEHRIDGAGAPRRVLVAASAVGVVGLLLLAHAPPDDTLGIAGVLLVSGIAWSVTRSVVVLAGLSVVRSRAGRAGEPARRIDTVTS